MNALGVVGVAPIRDPNISNWYGAAGVNVNIPIFNGYLFNARAKMADLETQARQKQLQDLQNNVARDVRNAWLDTQKAYERLSLTQELREQANLALELSQARYKLGLGSSSNTVKPICKRPKRTCKIPTPTIDIWLPKLFWPI